MADPDGVGLLPRQAARHGRPLAIDDFGKGYSSLSYLRGCRWTKSRSIARSSPACSDEDDIVKHYDRSRPRLGMTVVAEGVESRMERDHLRELACDAAQGRYLAAPCAPLEARRLVLEGGMGA